MPDNPVGFEDSQGNPDWAHAGKSVARSQVNESQLDVGSAEVSAEDKSDKPNGKAAIGNRWLRAGAFVAASIAFGWVVLASLVLVEFAPADGQRSGWLLLGLFIGGLLVTLLQLRSQVGPLAASAAVFGVIGARSLVLTLIGVIGFGLGVSAPLGAVSSRDLALFGAAAAVLVLSAIWGSSWWVRTISSIVMLGLAAYLTSLGGFGIQLNLGTIGIAEYSASQFELALLGFAIAIGTQLLVKLRFATRVALTVAVPVSVAFIELTASIQGDGGLPWLVCITIAFAILSQVQFAELTPSRRGALLLRSLALLTLVVTVIAAWLLQEVLDQFAAAALLVLLVWSSIQVPAVLARKLPLHKRSLALSFGFYSSIAWLPVIGFALSLTAAFVAVWLKLELSWLALAFAVWGLLTGAACLPRFLRSQAEHLAAEKRKNEPVRVSSEDLQWSD